MRVAKAKAEVKELRECEVHAAEEAIAEETMKASASSEGMQQKTANDSPDDWQLMLGLGAGSAGLHAQLQLLDDWRKERRKSSELEEDAEACGTGAASGGENLWVHRCIWRDELDIREGQLEKITAQLDRTNNALFAAQAALKMQRECHEEMKIMHRHAESELREGEHRRAKRQRQCAELRRAEAELRRVLEVNTPSTVAAASMADMGNGIATKPPLTALNGITLSQAPMQDRIAVISRETQRLAMLRRGSPPVSGGGDEIETDIR